MTRLLRAATVLLLALTGPAAAAQAQSTAPTAPSRASAPDTQAFVFQVARPFRLPAGDRAGAAVVIGDSVTIDGALSDALVVIDGTARVNGSVGSVVVISGHAALGPDALVAHDVVLVRSTLDQAPGATVGGEIRRRTGLVAITQRALFFVWLSMTVAMLGAGFLFATFGRVPLEGAAALLRRDAARAVLGALALWVALPFAAFLTVATGIGVPLGAGIMVFLLPALWFLGYLVAGGTVGRAVVRWVGSEGAGTTASVLAGILVLQLAQLIPGLGAATTMAAGLLGSGAIAARLWVRRSRRAERTEVAEGEIMAPPPAGAGVRWD